MRLVILTFALTLSFLLHATEIPKHAEIAIKKSGLEISKKLKPIYLSGDFNGDGKVDLVFYVVNKSDSKSGLCILHLSSSKCITLSAGATFYAGGDDFKWVDIWEIIPSGETWEMIFKPNVDVLGSRKVVLLNKSIKICVIRVAVGQARSEMANMIGYIRPTKLLTIKSRSLAVAHWDAQTTRAHY